MTIAIECSHRIAAWNLVRFFPIVTLDEQTFVLHVAGDEDRATQSRRRRPLSRVMCALRDDLTVDLSELSFADASLIIDLAIVARRLRNAGRTMVLQGAQPQIQRLIEVVGLDRMPGVLVAAAAG